MTRGVDSAIVTKIETGEYAPIFMIDAEFQDSAGVDDTLYLWTGLGTVAYGGNDYAGTGTLLTIEGIEEILEVVSRGATFTLDGIGGVDVNANGDDIIDLAYRSEYQNRPLTLRFAILNMDTRTIIGSPVVWFSGKMDVMEPEEDGQTAKISLTVENALVALERRIFHTYTKEDQQEEYPGDTFFDQVTDLQNKEITLE